jgi:C2 domain-containing protein 3
MTPNDDIRMAISIEAAANLPKVIVKKNRNKRKSKTGGTSPQQRAEYDPISYATFEASIGSNYQSSIVKSHEGNVYCTKVLKGCNPQWNEVFEVGIPFDILRNPQKRFVVKVWRKAKFDQQQQFTPKPFEDAVIGFSAIDLSALLTGLPHLSGYYNIVDFSGRTNGQIQLSFKPLQDIDAFRSPSSPLVPLTCPLNIDVNCMETSSDGSSILSRTLKRKFTELDEITQRLKARLFDVTGDEHFDPDEEFERDLNTTVEDEEDECVKEDFAWLRKDDDGNGFQAQINKILDPHQPSTSKGTTTIGSSSIPTHREILGCSGSDDEPPPFVIDQLLKKYDLDTLINPNIFKNIIDPNAADSDSTPTLVPKQIENIDGTEGNLGSADTTVSSIISNDQLQTIQKALQRTSLHEPESQEEISKNRKDPEGEQHASE